VPRARRRATAGIGQEWATAALAELCRSYAKKILRTTSHYQESGRCGKVVLHIEHFEAVKLFDMAHENRHQSAAQMISLRRCNFSEFREGFRGVGWFRKRGQRSESGKALPGAKAGAACAKGNPKFATHIAGSGDAHSQDYRIGNSARDEHPACALAALITQEPARNATSAIQSHRLPSRSDG